MIYPRTKQDSQMVAQHYNELDVLFRQMWGIHLHHGFWRSGDESIDAAVQSLVELVAEKAQLKPGQSVCDIGCGYGATSVMLAQKWAVQLTSITISQAQYDYATAGNHQGNPHFICGDWLQNDLPSAVYDAAIAIESSEHMPDKEKFFHEAFRILRPKGKLVVCAWLAKDSASAWDRRFLLEPICQEAHLPSMGSTQDYIELMKNAGFENIECEDISQQVKKTWAICARRLFAHSFTNKMIYRLLLNRHATERLFAVTIFRMLFAYQKHCLSYGIFVANKP